MKKIYPILLILITLLVFTSGKKYALDKPTASIKDSIPVFLEGYKYENVDGTKFSFNQVKGKVLLLDFWATWCGPCIKGHSNIKALEETINNPDFQIITVSIDKNKSQWKKFLKAKKWNGIHIILDGKDVNNPLNKMVTKKILDKGKPIYLTSVPEYYLVDKELSMKRINDVKAKRTVSLIRKKIN